MLMCAMHGRGDHHTCCCLPDVTQGLVLSLLHAVHVPTNCSCCAALGTGASVFHVCTSLAPVPWLMNSFCLQKAEQLMSLHACCVVSTSNSLYCWSLAAVQSICPQQGCRHAGPARTVEFDFDMGADTAMSVASEMVEDLSLSHEDARAIAAAIKQEIKQLTGQAPMFSVVDRSAPLASFQLHHLQACSTMNTLILLLTCRFCWACCLQKAYSPVCSQVIPTPALHVWAHPWACCTGSRSYTSEPSSIQDQGLCGCLSGSISLLHSASSLLTDAAAIRRMWRPG